MSLTTDVSGKPRLSAVIKSGVAWQLFWRAITGFGLSYKHAKRAPTCAGALLRGKLVAYFFSSFLASGGAGGAPAGGAGGGAALPAAAGAGALPASAGAAAGAVVVFSVVVVLVVLFSAAGAAVFSAGWLQPDKVPSATKDPNISATVNNLKFTFAISSSCLVRTLIKRKVTLKKHSSNLFLLQDA